MGHNINSEGQFQSDKYPDLPPDKIILSFKDPVAREALNVYAKNTKVKKLAEDILACIQSIVIGGGSQSN